MTNNPNNPAVNAPLAQPAEQTEDFISLRDILDIVINNWKWFVVSVIVCVGLARLYLATQNPMYQRHAVMLVKEEDNRRSNTDALQQLSGIMVGSSVANEIYILSSHQLVKEVVKNLHLDIRYSVKTRFKSISLYQVRPFEVQFLDTETTPALLQVTVEGDKACTITAKYMTPNSTEEQEWTANVKYGESVSSPVGNFIVIPMPEYIADFDGVTVDVAHMTLENAVNAVANQITTGAVNDESSLVRITCVDTSIERADDILAALIVAYKKSIVDDKNTVAQSTAEFIDERIALISRELSEVEGDLAEFKQSNDLVDFSLNASSFIQQSSTARQRTIQLQAQQEAVKYVIDEMESSTTGNKLIPSLGSLTDAGIQTQISKYNDLMLQRNRLAENSGEKSLVVTEMDANLAQLRQTLIVSMRGYANTIDIQVEQSLREERGLKGTIHSMPQKEQKALDISRQQSIKETLYTYLLNKREETALQLAVNEANIRVVEEPYGSRTPISPRKMATMGIAFLLGLILPFAYFWVRELLNMGVRGRKDVETYTTIPIIGEIPHSRGAVTSFAQLIKGNTPLAEAFRMARFSLNFMHRDAKVVMLTSTTPSEGKTFCSRCLAYTMAATGKKVLLIDADIRKRTQSRILGQDSHDGLTSYLSGQTDDVKSLIVTDPDQHGVDFLPSGIVPPNPAELLMSDRLDALMASLRDQYDCIIIDNVPAKSVVDASIINRVADATVYIIRQGKIDRRFLPELERMHQEKVFNNLCALVNDTDMEKKRYGYGYTYYSYTYGTNGKRKRSLWRKLFRRHRHA